MKKLCFLAVLVLLAGSLSFGSVYMNVVFDPDLGVYDHTEGGYTHPNSDGVYFMDNGASPSAPATVITMEDTSGPGDPPMYYDAAASTFTWEFEIPTEYNLDWECFDIYLDGSENCQGVAAVWPGIAILDGSGSVVENLIQDPATYVYEGTLPIGDNVMRVQVTASTDACFDARHDIQLRIQNIKLRWNAGTGVDPLAQNTWVTLTDSLFANSGSFPAIPTNSSENFAYVTNPTTFWPEEPAYNDDLDVDTVSDNSICCYGGEGGMMAESLFTIDDGSGPNPIALTDIVAGTVLEICFGCDDMGADRFDGSWITLIDDDPATAGVQVWPGGGAVLELVEAASPYAGDCVSGLTDEYDLAITTASYCRHFTVITEGSGPWNFNFYLHTNEYAPLRPINIELGSIYIDWIPPNHCTNEPAVDGVDYDGSDCYELFDRECSRNSTLFFPYYASQSCGTSPGNQRWWTGLSIDNTGWLANVRGGISGIITFYVYNTNDVNDVVMGIYETPDEVYPGECYAVMASECTYTGLIEWISGWEDWSGAAASLSDVSPYYEGYVVAVCDFPFAHGFAFIGREETTTDGAMAYGYLPLVITGWDNELGIYANFWEDGSGPVADPNNATLFNTFRMFNETWGH